MVTTISLPKREFELLADFARTKEMSKGNVVAHALRVLSALEQKLNTGAKVFLEDEQKNKAELVLL